MKPYYEDGMVTLYCGDSLEIMRELPAFHAIVTDPPYGDTSLVWDRAPDPEWLSLAAEISRNLWCFGSLRFFLTEGQHFGPAGWRYAQEIIWEKHNGSGFHADRFKRVHELAVHWYHGEWASIHKEPPLEHFYGAGTKMTLRRKQRPPHTGHIEEGAYMSEDGGPRLMRSVQQVRSEHGRAVHPTQKPLGILRPLIEFSCPVDGIVLDPFAGSGSTLLAARELGRRAVGIEAREDYCAAAVGRLAQMELAA